MDSKKESLETKRPIQLSKNSRIIIVLSAISLVSNNFITSGIPESLSRLIGGIIGSAIPLSIFSIIFGLIPYYLSNNRTTDKKISIFGTIFIFLCILTIIGSIWKETQVLHYSP